MMQGRKFNNLSFSEKSENVARRLVNIHSLMEYKKDEAINDECTEEAIKLPQSLPRTGAPTLDPVPVPFTVCDHLPDL
jgi:hypothetical protein